jgi:hypothetical protein
MPAAERQATRRGKLRTLLRAGYEMKKKVMGERFSVPALSGSEDAYAVTGTRLIPSNS